MGEAYQRDIDGVMRSKRVSYLRYEGEDDQVYILSDGGEAPLIVHKNRDTPEPSLGQRPQPLAPAFRLLGVAVLGLAPAGLCTLVLAPLAMLWAIALLLTQPLSRADRIRVLIVLGIAAALLGLAIPLSRLFLVRLS
jgi:hypothetical protein